MRFGDWLLDQHKRNDSVGELARALARDVKAGCLSASPKTPYVLERHIVVRHEGRITDDNGAMAQAEFQWRESLSLAPHQSRIGSTSGGSL